MQQTNNKKGRIGLICATEGEIATLISSIDEATISRKSMLEFYQGTIKGVPVAATVSGIGKIRSAIATQILINFFFCKAIINFGTAGGIDEGVRILDTVISTECAYWDVSDNTLAYMRPNMNTNYFFADSFLLSLVQKAVVECKTTNQVFWGRMVTGDIFADNILRARIKESFFPLSVDMETASIAYVCQHYQTPYISVRTITDTYEHTGCRAFSRNYYRASKISCDIVIEMFKAMHGNFPIPEVE